MNAKPLRNIAASVRARLAKMAKEKHEDFQRLLVRYATERFLYRLYRSSYAGKFVLKGATLFIAQSGWPYRPTRDLDLLGLEGRTADTLTKTMREICTVKVEEDGVLFDPASVKVRAIREDQEHGGLRVLITAALEQARVQLQIDVGFGDTVVPPAQEIAFPSLLGFPAARIRAYSKETVIAEKTQALIVLGDVNSRMKDYYDFWAMSRTLPFEGADLIAAIGASFAGRRTQVPQAVPDGLTDDFAAGREIMWQGFLRRVELRGAVPNLGEIIHEVRNFLLPPLEAVRDNRPFNMTWPPGGPWQKRVVRKDGG